MFAFLINQMRRWRKFGWALFGIVVLSLLLLRQHFLTPEGIILDPAKCPKVDLSNLACGNTSATESKGTEVETIQGALEFRRLQLQDENGVIAPDGVLKAAEHIKMMKANMPEALTSVGGINTWRWLGPTRVGGRIRALVIHPTLANVLFQGARLFARLKGESQCFPISLSGISF